MRAEKLLVIGVVIIVAALWAVQPEAARARQPYRESPQRFGKRLLTAIHTGNWKLAQTLLPNGLEAMQLSLPGLTTATGYQTFLAKRRRGFAKVVAKFRRKGCRTVHFSRFKYGPKVTKHGVQVFQSVDLFALCDGREVWVADPDQVFMYQGRWRLLEFD